MKVERRPGWLGKLASWRVQARISICIREPQFVMNGISSHTGKSEFGRRVKDGVPVLIFGA
jgi:hypothetical protein